MANTLTLTQTQQGWILKMPAEMAEVLGAAEGSLLMLYAKL